MNRIYMIYLVNLAILKILSLHYLQFTLSKYLDAIS